MPSSSAFPKPSGTIINASDKISRTRDKTIYNELATNITIDNNIAQQKDKNHVMYQENFFQKSCGGSSQPKLAAAKNYELLLSIIKGKRYNNPTLEGGSARSLQTAQNGNHLLVTYDNNTKVPVAAVKEDSSCGHPIISTDWTIDASGTYIIDPNKEIFYSECDSKPSPWKQKNIVETSFQDLNSYWRSANAQPLTGMSFSSNITIGKQLPVPFSTEYPYPPKTSPSSGTELYNEWCKKNKLI